MGWFRVEEIYDVVTTGNTVQNNVRLNGTTAADSLKDCGTIGAAACPTTIALLVAPADRSRDHDSLACASGNPSDAVVPGSCSSIWSDRTQPLPPTPAGAPAENMEFFLYNFGGTLKDIQPNIRLLAYELYEERARGDVTR